MRHTAPASRRRPVSDLIAQAGDQLTPAERLVANVVDEDPTALAFGTVAGLAGRAGVSGPTVVRFATRLGFDGFAALQEHARRAVSHQLVRPTDRLRTSAHPGVVQWAERCDGAVASVSATLDRIGPDRIDTLAAALVGHDNRVWILSSGPASAAARVLSDGLSLLRPGVHLVHGAGAPPGTQLVDATARDVAVAIDTPRYERRIVDTASWLAGIGATVLAITDGPLSPLATIAKEWCPVEVSAAGPFDSALPAVAIVESIVTTVADRMGSQASSRLDRAETLWDLDGMFHDG